MIRTTRPQRQMLLNLAAGRPTYTSMHASPTTRRRVADALRAKGLIDAGSNITAAGRSAVNTPEKP